jgi:hypothetical protein
VKEFGVPDKLVRLVKMSLESTNNKVKVHGKMSPSFQTVARLRQGDSLSTLLFNPSVENVIRNVKTNPGGSIFIKTKQRLAPADDVVIFGRALRHVTETVGDMTTVATQLGLTINTTEKKNMIFRKDNGNEPKEIEIRGQKYEKVEMFKYLGSLATNLNDIETEIKTRLTAVNKCYHALGHILKKGIYPKQ